MERTTGSARTWWDRIVIWRAAMRLAVAHGWRLDECIEQAAQARDLLHGETG